MQDRNLRLLLTASIVSDTGTAVSALAIPLIAVEQLHAAPAVVGVLGALATFPQLLLSLWAGALADRYDKRRLMVISDSIRLLLMASLPIASLAGVLTTLHLCAVVLLEATAGLFFAAASSSIGPELFGTGSELGKASSRLSAGFSAALLLGPSLGGLLVAVMGAAGAVSLDALSYAVSVLMVLGLRRRPPVSAAPVPSSPSTPRPKARDGLRFVFSRRDFRSIALANSVDSFLMAGWQALWLVYVVKTLGWSSAEAGLVLGAGGLGGLAGSFSAARLVKRFGTFPILLATSLAAVPCYLVTPLLGHKAWGPAAVLASTVLTLFATMIFTTAARTYRQTTCPPALLGRVMMTSRWMSWGSRPLGALAGGALTFWITPRSSLLLIGSALALPFVVLALGRPRASEEEDTGHLSGIPVSRS